MWKCTECGHENPDNVGVCEECDHSRDPSTLVGMQINHWVLERQLGEGGMAVVFLARHKMLNSPVAVKLLRADLTHKREVIERFRTEALAASQLNHENVIQVLDFGHQKGIGFYMVLEFLKGRDLEEYIEDHIGMQIPISRTIGIVKQMCAGLQAAHDANIIHRDLKPSNVFLVPREDNDIPLAKVLDFGIAKIQESELEEGQQKLTRTGTVLGTPFYLAPEQLTRKSSSDLTAAVDIYAFGVILFQMLTGELPIEEPTVAEQMVAILTKNPPKLGDIREEFSGTALEIFIMRMLAKKPEARPATISDAWEEFEAAASILVEEDTGADEALRKHWETAYQPFLEDDAEQSFLQKWRWALLAAMVPLLGGIGWLIYRAVQPPQTKVVVVREKPQKMPELPQLQAEGIKAFNNQDYSKAIALWRKMTRSKQWKSSSKYYNPKIYKSLGVALIRKKLIYSAVKEYKKYLKSAKLEPVKKKQFEAFLNKLEANLAQRKKAALQLSGDLSLLLKRNAHDKARKSYRTFFKAGKKGPVFKPDPSLPGAYVKAGKSLEPYYPEEAVKLYKKALKLDTSKTQKSQLRQKIRRIEQDREAKSRKLLEQLSASIKAKKSRDAKKALTSLVRDYSAIPGVHDEIQKILKKNILEETRTTKRVIKTYAKEAKRLRASKSWTWLKSGGGKTLPDEKKLDSFVKDSATYKRTHKQFERAKEQLAKGKLSNALRRFTKLNERWQKLNTSSSWKEEIGVESKQTRQWVQRLKKAVEGWEKARKLHREERLHALNEETAGLLKLLEGSAAQEHFRKKLKKWEERHLKARKYLEDAEKHYNRRRWKRAETRYIWYMKMFPRSVRKKEVTKQIDECQCRRNVPWKICPKKYK